MTFVFQQLDTRGSLNLPAEWRRKYDMKAKGGSIACLDCNGVIVMVPLVGDAHHVYQAHGEGGLREWVNQRSGLALPITVTPPPPKSKEERKADLQEKRILLRHTLKMQQLSATAELIRLRQCNAKVKAEATVAAKAVQRAARYDPSPPPTPTPEEVDQFLTQQAVALSGSPTLDEDIDGEPQETPPPDLAYELGLPQA